MASDTEADILRGAIAATEGEIFGEAFDKEDLEPLDESGNKSLEEMGEGLEGQHEPDEDDDDGEEGEGGDEPLDKADDGKEKVAAASPPEGKVEHEPKKGEGRVPAGRLREQTEKVRAAETERDTLKALAEADRSAHQKEILALNAKFDGLLSVLQSRQPATPAKPAAAVADAPPDIFEDPQGYTEFIQRDFRNELQRRDKAMEDMRVETSLQVAHAKHGDEFAAAFDSVKKLDPQNPDNQSVVRRIYSSPNPGEMLVQWHKRNEVLRQVGSDPTKYREQVASETREALMNDPEFRKQILEDLRADAVAGDHGRPRTMTKLPRSLSQASGGNSGRSDDTSSPDGSDRAVFDSAFTA